MALLNISNDWLDADSRDSYMLLQNGDDFDLHLPPLGEPKTEKLLDVITTEGEHCRVLLIQKTYNSNVEVAYVLKTDRGYELTKFFLDDHRLTPSQVTRFPHDSSQRGATDDL